MDEQEREAFLYELFDRNKGKVVERIKDAFLDIPIYLDEPEGEVDNIQVQSVSITDKQVVDTDDNDATFRFSAQVKYSADLSWADNEIEGFPVSEAEESTERVAELNVEMRADYDLQNEYQFRIASLGIQEGSITLRPDYIEMLEQER